MVFMVKIIHGGYVAGILVEGDAGRAVGVHLGRAEGRRRAGIN